jgi:hypothetical protein
MQNLSPATSLPANLASIIQDELRKQMEATVELMQRMKKELGEEEASNLIKQAEKAKEAKKRTGEEPVYCVAQARSSETPFGGGGLGCVEDGVVGREEFGRLGV